MVAQPVLHSQRSRNLHQVQQNDLFAFASQRNRFKTGFSMDTGAARSA
jgi:hypothetical protein